MMVWVEINNQRVFEFDHAQMTLLEALERHGYTIEYQCRQGFCGSCQCKMTRGEVDYDPPPIAFVREGNILPCCCKIESDDVAIELDNAPYP